MSIYKKCNMENNFEFVVEKLKVFPTPIFYSLPGNVLSDIKLELFIIKF